MLRPPRTLLAPELTSVAAHPPRFGLSLFRLIAVDALSLFPLTKAAGLW